MPLAGVQHKYKETVLFFPSAGQTCHAYCTFCFRWPQFVGMEELKFDARASADLATYLRRHAEVTDVLITGGDPLVMNARSLTDYIELAGAGPGAYPAHPNRHQGGGLLAAAVRYGQGCR